jgi:hypothetical protein
MEGRLERTAVPLHADTWEVLVFLCVRCLDIDAMIGGLL